MAEISQIYLFRTYEAEIWGEAVNCGDIQGELVAQV